MKSLYIRFLTEQDRVRGFYALATRARITSLPGEVFQIPIEGLSILDTLHIAYRRASDAEVKDAYDKVRNPSATVL
jgi:hypothetical protein